MLEFIKNFFISKRLASLEDIIAIYAKDLEEANLTQSRLKSNVNALAETLAYIKVNKATPIDRLSVTAHAVHRYRERHKAKGTDAELYKELYKAVVRETANLDSIPNGVYTVRTGVALQVVDETVVTVLPKRAARPQQKFKKR